MFEDVAYRMETGMNLASNGNSFFVACRQRRFSYFQFLSVICTAIFFAASARGQTFDQTLAQVYQTNPSLRAERARLREVDEQVSQALGGWRPSVDATANAGRIYQTTPNTLAVPPYSALATKAVGVQVTQPVFRGFRTVESTRSAKKLVDAERATLQSVEQQVFLSAGTAYLDIVRDQTLVDLNHSYRDVLKRYLQDSHERFKAHDVTRTDVDQAETRLQRAEANSILVEVNLANHRTVYAHLAGEIPEKLSQPRLELPPIESLDAALHTAEKKNPAILAAGFSEESARHDVEANKGSLLPEVDLIGSMQRQWGVSSIIPGQQDTAQVLAQMTMPLYRAGTDYSKTRAAQNLVAERRMLLEDARRQARESLANAWQSLKASRAVIAADKAEQSAAELARNGVKTEVPAGSRTTLDLLNAEQELIDAKTSLAQAEHDEALSILQIRSAIGELTAAALALPVTLYDPEAHYDMARDSWFGFDNPESYESVPEPAVKPDTEGSVKPLVVPVMESLVTPVGEPVAEPVSESVAAPDTAPVTEVVAEPSTEFSAEPASAPVATSDDPAAESAAPSNFAQTQEKAILQE
jgi:TolC family type I secretion outer membrane protein